MPYELKATLSLTDNLSGKMNKAAAAVERFNRAMDSVSGSMNQLNRLHSDLGDASRGASSQIASTNRAISSGMNDVSRAVKNTQSDFNSLHKSMEDYQAAGKKTQNTLEKLDVANTKHNNSIAESTAKTNDFIKRSNAETSNFIQAEQERRKTMTDDIIGQTLLAEQKGQNEINKIIEDGNQKRLNSEQITNDKIREMNKKLDTDVKKIQESQKATDANIASRRDAAKDVLDYRRELSQLDKIEKAHGQAIAEDARRTREAADAQERLNKARWAGVKNGARNAGGNMMNTAGNMGRTLGFGLGMVGFGAAYGAGYLGVQGLSDTMQFEQRIADIRAYADPEQRKNYHMYDKNGKMTPFADYVMKMSGELPFNSLEVLDSAFEQSKAGVSYNDLIGKDGRGQLRTSLQIAAATDWVPEEAAAMLQQVKGSFRNNFKEMMKKDSNLNLDEYIGNVITAGANFSTLDPEDYKKMLSMGAGVTAQTGMSFEDYIMFGTAMNKTAGFVNGSDIGTSLKTWSNMVTNPTSGARGGQAAMEGVGWYKDGKNQFYQDGKLKPIEDLAKLVYENTKHLDNEGRVKLFNEVGGADAGRAFGGLFELGKDKEIMKALKKELGIADIGEQVTERLKTTAMKLQLFQQAWQNMMITFWGETLAPLASIFEGMTKYMQTDKFKASVQSLGKDLSDFLTSWWEGLDDLSYMKDGKEVKWDAMPTMDKIIMAIDSALNRMSDSFGESPAGQKLSETVSKMIGKMIEWIVETAVKALMGFTKDQATLMFENLQNGNKKEALTNGALAFGGANMLTMGLAGTALGGGLLWGGKKMGRGLGKAGRWAWNKTPWGGDKPTSPDAPNKRPSVRPKAGGMTFSTQSLKDAGSKVFSKDMLKTAFNGIKGGAVVEAILTPLDMMLNDKTLGESLSSRLKDPLNQGLMNLTLKGTNLLLPKDLEFSDEEIARIQEGANAMVADFNNFLAQFDFFNFKFPSKGEGIAGLGTTIYNAALGYSQKVADGFASAFNFSESGGIGVVSGGGVIGAILGRDGRIATAAKAALAAALNSIPIPGFNFGAAVGALVARVTNSARASALSAINSAGTGGINLGIQAGQKASQLLESNAGGEPRVHRDGPRYLHKDEMILTRGQANEYRKGGSGSDGLTVVITGNTFGAIRSQDDVDALAKALAREIQQAGGLIG